MKKIKVRKKGKTAVLISFDTKTDKFESNYERNKFYRGLYGWVQKIRKGEKCYEYRKKGLLDEIPHIKVDNSVFIVREMEKILDYLRDWDEKVEYNTFDVLLDDDKFKKLKKEGRNIEIE